MTAMMSYKLKAWQTPNFATVDLPTRPKQDGIVALPSVAVKDIPQEALDSLAQQWIEELYAKAGKTPPAFMANRKG